MDEQHVENQHQCTTNTKTLSGHETLSFSISRILNIPPSSCSSPPAHPVSSDGGGTDDDKSDSDHNDHQSKIIFTPTTSGIFSDQISSAGIYTGALDGGLECNAAVIRVPAHRPIPVGFQGIFPWMESRRLARDRLTGR